MALHTAVFLGTGTASWAPLPGASDGVFGLLGNGLIPPQETRLVAAVAGGFGVTAARLEQRSMDITPANIHPLNVLPWPSPVGFVSYPGHAPRLPAGEAVTASTFGGGAKGAVVCWFCDRVEPVPEGQSFLLGFTVDVTLVDKTWVRAELDWDVPYLPVGRYHVVGMTAHTESGEDLKAVAARLVLPNQVHRPGALVLEGETLAEAAVKLPPPFQTDGSLGAWGWFEQGSPPRVEVIGFDTPLVMLKGFLRVIKEMDGGNVRGGGAAWG